MSNTLDCEFCGVPFSTVVGKGHTNRVSCYACTNPTTSRKNSYRNKLLKGKYGITLYQSKQLFDRQAGKCAACGRSLEFWNSPNPKGVRRNGYETCVDHDHESGRIRGILCFHCNTALGHLQDSPKVVSDLLVYISSHK